MKILVILAVVFFIVAPIFGLGFMPDWWDNPHKHFFKIDQAKIFSSDSKNKPDLRRIKENLYMPIEARIHGSKYLGLITLKPDPSGNLKAGGAIFRDGSTSELGLLTGEIVDKETYYQINFKSTNASKLFNSQKKYQSLTELPTPLEIRSYGKKNTPHIVGPLDLSSPNYVKFPSVQVNLEKTYIGKWEASSFEGFWSFEFSQLPGSQLTGLAHYGFGEKKCSYPMFGFPLGGNRMVFMTGESSIQSDECETRSWISYSEKGPIVQFEPYEGEGLRLTLKRQ